MLHCEQLRGEALPLLCGVAHVKDPLQRGDAALHLVRCGLRRPHGGGDGVALGLNAPRPLLKLCPLPNKELLPRRGANVARKVAAR